MRLGRSSSVDNAGIYILAIPWGKIFVQIQKRKNLKDFMKKGRERGGEEEKEKSDKAKHTLKTFMKLK